MDIITIMGTITKFESLLLTMSMKLDTVVQKIEKIEKQGKVEHRNMISAVKACHSSYTQVKSVINELSERQNEMSEAIEGTGIIDSVSWK